MSDPVSFRLASEADAEALHELWAEFEADWPEPEGWAPERWEDAWARLRVAFTGGGVALALDGDGAAGLAWLAPPEAGRAQLELVHVRERARRRGVAKGLLALCLAELAAKGATTVSLDVLTANETAVRVWHRLGFEPVEQTMAAPLAELARRVGEAVEGETRGAVHVRSDDRRSIDNAVAQFLPRLGAPEVSATANGWIRIADPHLDADREAQTGFARDLSDRLGTVALALALERGAVVRYRLFEHGRMVDEYLSVPTYYGPLAKVDELALVPNPTLVSRLTGAPFAEVHRVARTAASTSELPPAAELYEAVARMMGVEP